MEGNGGQGNESALVLVCIDYVMRVKDLDGVLT